MPKMIVPFRLIEKIFAKRLQPTIQSLVSTYLKKTLEEKEKTSFQLQPIFPPNKK